MGFIDLGVMGLPMYQRLIQSGYQVVVRYLDPNYSHRGNFSIGALVEIPRIPIFLFSQE